MDPNLRFEIDDIKQHKYFKNIDWKQVAEKKYKPLYIPPSKNNGFDNLEIPSLKFDMSSEKSSPLRKAGNAKVLGDYHLAKINKVFEDF
jgi:hypothetical protein